MLKAIIFDVNGVFIRSPKLSERFEKKFGVREKDFLAALEEIMGKVRLPGAGDAFSYWFPHFEKWNVKLTEEEFFDFWFGAEKEVAEMVLLARELKNKRFKIFILSNNFKERTEYYDKNFPFLKEVANKIYFSWQIGYLKSDPNVYQLVIRENNLKPEECIFFDDSQKNVEVASSLGIKSFLFKDAEQVRNLLK